MNSLARAGFKLLKRRVPQFSASGLTLDQCCQHPAGNQGSRPVAVSLQMGVQQSLARMN